MQKVLPLALALLTVALAGCSDDAPSGEFSFQNHAVGVEGTAQNEYTAFNDPLGGQLPDEVPAGDCAQDQIPNLPEDQRCTPAETSIMLAFTELPDPEARTYSAYLVDSSGVTADKLLGTLTGDAASGFELNFTEGEDYSNEEQYTYDLVEVRLDAPTAVPVASASASGGSQTFELNEGLVSGVDFTGTWTGSSLTVTVSGLNTTFAYEGWLVAEGGEHVESFPVSNGENTFDAEAGIDTYAEFHIHVAGTKINVGVTTIS